MKYRKLRIAWSLAWGVLAILLVVLSVRSYRWIDELSVPITTARSWGMCSAFRHVGFVLGDTRKQRSFLKSFKVSPETDDQGVPKLILGTMTTVTGYRIFWMPHWLFAVLFATLSISPWLRWRFSLRTLLIATTLIALLLGAIVWAAK